MDLGQKVRGVDMGPSAIRYAGLGRRLRALGHEVADAGNVTVPVRDHLDQSHPSSYVGAIADVCSQVAEAGATAMEEGVVPIFLGGDHSMSIGSVSGVVRRGRTGVLWVDAHGDYNTPETSPSGNIHGMPLAVLMGDGHPELVSVGGEGAKLRAEDVVLIGIRDLDESEKTRLKASGITVYTTRDIDERGIAAVTREAIARLQHVDYLHVSLDLDVLEPAEAPGVGTPVHGGMTYREAQLVCELLADTKRVTSLDVVEVNPILDERNTTAETAVELVESIFGKAIY
jgi:arginase